VEEPVVAHDSRMPDDVGRVVEAEEDVLQDLI
jgi:hypothetical protein